MVRRKRIKAQVRPHHKVEPDEIFAAESRAGLLAT